MKKLRNEQWNDISSATKVSFVQVGNTEIHESIEGAIPCCWNSSYHEQLGYKPEVVRFPRLSPEPKLKINTRGEYFAKTKEEVACFVGDEIVNLFPTRKII